MSGGVIAIDGPSASGKSSTARAVAEELGFAHLDSGSLYRGVALVALREAARRGLRGQAALSRLSPETILRAAEDRGLMLQSDGIGFSAYLEGEPAEDALRSVEVTTHVSAVAAMPVVREWVNTRLRAMVRAGQDVVVDGRDIGTVVFPDAPLTAYLTARLEVRAGRRHKEVADLEYEAVVADMARRDTIDEGRELDPLLCAEDAVTIDTTDRSVEEIVADLEGRL